MADTGHVTAAENGAGVVAILASGESRVLDGGYSWASPNGGASSWRDAPDNPVTVIAAVDARAYCAWTGGRLPTEAEWEFQAREGAARPFPWDGDAGPLFAAQSPVWRGAPDGRALPVAVDQAAGATPGGILGLAGNAREWVVADGGTVLKGGAWTASTPPTCGWRPVS